MDLKGLCWVGGICQKIESLYEEGEETVYPDAVKYVEDQMQSIGATFKKIYTEVMHDLQPPSSSDAIQAEAPPSSSDPLNAESSPSSSDPLEAEGSKVTIVHNADIGVYKVPKVSREEECENNEAERLVKSSDNAENDDTENLGSCCSTICNVGKSCYVEEQRAIENIECQCSVEGQQCVNGNIECQCSVEEQPCVNGNIECQCVNDDDGNHESFCGLRDVGPKPASVVEVSLGEEEGEVSDQVTDGNQNFNPGAVEGSNSNTAAPSCWSISVKFEEALYPMASRKLESADANNHGAVVIEPAVDLNLGESCVLVHKNEHSLQNEQKPYKKKLTNMFSTRRSSKDKQEKDQVAVWYNKENRTNLFPISVVHGEHDSLSDNSSESDWELV